MAKVSLWNPSLQILGGIFCAQNSKLDPFQYPQMDQFKMMIYGKQQNLATVSGQMSLDKTDAQPLHDLRA